MPPQEMLAEDNLRLLQPGRRVLLEARGRGEEGITRYSTAPQPELSHLRCPQLRGWVFMQPASDRNLRALCGAPHFIPSTWKPFSTCLLNAREPCLPSLQGVSQVPAERGYVGPSS